MQQDVFRLKPKQKVYEIVSTSQGHHLIAGVKGNSCVLFGLHRAPLGFMDSKAHKRGD